MCQLWLLQINTSPIRIIGNRGAGFRLSLYACPWFDLETGGPLHPSRSFFPQKKIPFSQLRTFVSVTEPASCSILQLSSLAFLWASFL